MRPDELTDKLEEIERHLFDLRTHAFTEKLENSKAISNAKKDVARVKTVIQENQLNIR